MVRYGLGGGYDSWRINGSRCKCYTCGGYYYESDGGCGCTDDMECACGDNDWVDYMGTLECSSCGSGVFEEGTIHREATHVAAKTYNEGLASEIRPGDTYRKTVERGHWPNGPWGPWHTSRKRLAKGPAWGLN